MAGLHRSVKTCAKSRSMQPFWLASLVVGFLICHLMFDSVKRMIGLQESRIAENVEDYYHAGNARSQERNTRAKELLAQVKSGEKPLFVLSEALANGGTVRSVDKDQRKISLWIDKTYPYLYEYKGFSELPSFSKPACRQNLKTFIPNVVHYVWFGKLYPNFLQYLSVRSAATVQRPSRIIVHTDSGEPEGKYWKSLRAEVPCLEVRYLAKPTTIFGRHGLTEPQQQSHIARLQILYQEGGIYASMNVIFVRPFDKLMMKSVVLGKEEYQYYGNSIILAARGAPFLAMWFTAYNRRLVDWATYSIHVPYRLHRENPSMSVHVEDYSMMRPNFNEDKWITDENWPLDENYCVRLHPGRERIKQMLARSPLELINMDNTAGQLTRVVLFGKSYLGGEENLFRSMVHSKVPCSSKRQHNDDRISSIVHYVLCNDKFTYKHYLSVRSAVRNLKPKSVYIHLLQSKEPDSFYWIRMVVETGCITMALSHKGKELPSNATHAQTSSRRRDVVRQVLLDHGGIFLSFDVIVTSSFTDVIGNHVILGRSAAYSGNLDVVMSSKNSKFLSNWFSWDKQYPESVKEKIEKYTADNPSEVIEIVENFPLSSPGGGWTYSNFDHRGNRCFVVSERDTKVSFDDDFMYRILRSNSLTGRMARIAHFGTPEL